MYNKSGLLLDSFEREYRLANGKPVPFKFLGYESLIELLASLTDVVKVMTLDTGDTLLFAVSDEKTLHIAKMVGNQRDNVEGFNRRTARVVSGAGREVKLEIEKSTRVLDKKVSNYVKKQFRELLEDDEHIDGILLTDLPTVYDREFGYNIDYEEFGFNNLEEFCFHGLEDTVDMDLDNFQWKIVEKGMVGNTMSINKPKNVPDKLKKLILNIIDNHSAGLSVDEFGSIFSRKHGSLNHKFYGFHSLLELLLSVPDCVLVSLQTDHDHDQAVLFPLPRPDDAAGVDAVIEEVCHNIREFLEGHTELPLRSFISGYEGFYGDIKDKAVSSGCGDVLSLLMNKCSDVCTVDLTQSEPVIKPAQQPQSSSSSVPSVEHLIQSLHKILNSCEMGRIDVDLLPQSYRNMVGQNLAAEIFGFNNINLLLQHILDNYNSSLTIEDGKLSIQDQETNTPAESRVKHPTADKLKKQELGRGWVRIVHSMTPDQLCLQMENRRQELKKLEESMEMFYSWSKLGQSVSVGGLVAGDLVAALYSDLQWHRARVERVEAGRVELTYVDWGWVAWVRADTLMTLEQDQFLSLPAQVITVTSSQFQQVTGAEWSEAVTLTTGRGFISDHETSDDPSIELFVRKSMNTVDKSSESSEVVRKVKMFIIKEILKLLKSSH